MRFHWYWPHARPEELDWATGTARLGESIMVQVLDRPEAPPAGTQGRVTVVRDLPDVDRRVGPLLWAPSRAWTYLRRDRQRRMMWQGGEFDLLHIHYLNRFTDALLPLPTPLVLSVHDVVPHVTRLGHAGEHLLLTRIYERADALVVHHDHLRDELVRQFGVDTQRVFTVPHQVFPAPAVGLPPASRPPMLLFFGALRPNKGLDVLAQALALAPDLDVTVVIAGRGDKRLESMALAMARADRRVSTEIGHASLERKHALFADASVVLLPYTAFASQSGVLHDAYAHGRPVVCSAVGALGRSVAAEGTGLVAMPDSPADLVAKIRLLLEPTAWSACASAARAVAEDRSPASVGAQLRDVYGHILDR